MTTLQSIQLVYELYFKKGIPNIIRIQKMGLLAVKIGQIHAMRLDFLSAEKCKKLTELYRQNNPIPKESIDTILQSQKNNFLKNFSSFDKEPFATASVGQVYKAILTSGKQVVVKIIKPKLKLQFTKDVHSVKKLFKIVFFFYPKLKRVGDPIGILNDINTYTLTELDLRNEMQGAQILKKIYDAYRKTFDLSSLKFQTYYKDLSNENILVSEYIQTPSVDELLQKKKFSYKNLLQLFYIQGFYIFIAGKFHGDIHPGNVLFDGKHFYFVDTAYIGTVGDRIRKNLFYFFEALSTYDYSNCAYYLNQMAEKRVSGSTYEKFKKEFIKLYENYTNSTVSQVSLTKQMMLTIKLGVNSGMKFEKGIFPIIRSLMYLDGMVLSCNPKAKLVQDMRVFISAYKKFIT